MTPRQREYVRHRAAGLGQERAALEAGYAASSAKVSASRMERDPKIRAAIAQARQIGGGNTPAEFEDAESYLLAVVRGETPPDPVRVGAARAILPYQRAPQRARMRGATPRELDRQESLTEEQALLDAWAEKAKRIRERMGKG
jgi:hypothetical protein